MTLAGTSPQRGTGLEERASAQCGLETSTMPRGQSSLGLGFASDVGLLRHCLVEQLTITQSKGSRACYVKSEIARWM